MHTFLIGLASLATAASAQPAQMTPVEMLDAATVVCPSNPSVQRQRAAARAAHLSKRDGDIIIAMCAMYHLGRASAFGDSAEADRQGWQH